MGNPQRPDNQPSRTTRQVWIGPRAKIGVPRVPSPPGRSASPRSPCGQAISGTPHTPGRICCGPRRGIRVALLGCPPSRSATPVGTAGHTTRALARKFRTMGRTPTVMGRTIGSPPKIHDQESEHRKNVNLHNEPNPASRTNPHDPSDALLAEPLASFRRGESGAPMSVGSRKTNPKRTQNEAIWGPPGEKRTQSPGSRGIRQPGGDRGQPTEP